MLYTSNKQNISSKFCLNKGNSALKFNYVSLSVNICINYCKVIFLID